MLICEVFSGMLRRKVFFWLVKRQNIFWFVMKQGIFQYVKKQGILKGKVKYVLKIFVRNYHCYLIFRIYLYFFLHVCVFVEFKTVTDDHYVVTVSEEKFTKLYPQMMEEFNREMEEEKQQKLKGKKKKGRIFLSPMQSSNIKQVHIYFKILK